MIGKGCCDQDIRWAKRPIYTPMVSVYIRPACLLPSRDWRKLHSRVNPPALCNLGTPPGLVITSEINHVLTSLNEDDFLMHWLFPCALLHVSIIILSYTTKLKVSHLAVCLSCKHVSNMCYELVQALWLIWGCVLQVKLRLHKSSPKLINIY